MTNRGAFHPAHRPTRAANRRDCDSLDNAPRPTLFKMAAVSASQARASAAVLPDTHDLNNVFAELAHARYAPESEQDNTPCSVEALTMLTTVEEVRAAVDQVAASAQRLISIYSPNLEPELYDQSAFLEVIKCFVLARPFAKVRVLLSEPGRVTADGHRFMAMARRLSSCIEVRTPAAQPREHQSAYLVADSRAIVYRLRSDTWDGIADIDNPPVARLYLHEFEQLWDACAPEQTLRIARR